jgi:ribonucleoside-triphosphate reductase
MSQQISDIIKIFKALDREEKLKIVNLIAKEGENSVTDVKKKLKLSFSTAHKYLNDLEKSGILKSTMKITGGREKKLYSLTDFEITLNPRNIFAQNENKMPESIIQIVDSQGLPQELKISKLSETFIQMGIPIWVIETILTKLSNELYDGMSVSELKSAVLGILLEEKDVFNKTIEKMSAIRLFGDESLQNILKQKNSELPLKMYIGGNIDIYNVSIPKPISILHDIRLPLKYSMIENTPPGSLNNIINHIRTLIEMTHRDVIGPQAFNHLNVFLAPYISELNYPQLKQIIENLTNVYTHISRTIEGAALYYCLDLTIPQYLKKEPAIGPGGKIVGVYGDFESESQTLLKAILETIGNVQFPRLVFNLYKGWQNSELIKMVADISKNTRTLFANLNLPWQKNVSYFHEVMRISSESINVNDTMRTGNCQTTTINFPRIAWQAKDESQFLEILDKNLDACLDVITTSAESVGGKFHTTLSFISKKFNGESYYDLNNATYTICTCGFNEVVKKLFGAQLHEDKGAQDFVIKTLNHMQSFIHKKKTPLNIRIAEHTFRPILERFAKKDLKDFGDTIIYKGSTEDPYYTQGTSVAEDVKISTEEKIKIEEKFHPLQNGGHLSVVKKDKEIPDLLKIITKSNIGYFVIV